MLKNLNINICKSLFESTHLFKSYLHKTAAKYDRCIGYHKSNYLFCFLQSVSECICDKIFYRFLIIFLIV